MFYLIHIKFKIRRNLALFGNAKDNFKTRNLIFYEDDHGLQRSNARHYSTEVAASDM